LIRRRGGLGRRELLIAPLGAVLSADGFEHGALLIRGQVAEDLELLRGRRLGLSAGGVESDDGQRREHSADGK
jgi:hypothetical protein